MTQSPAEGPVPEQPGTWRPDASITSYGELYAPARQGDAAREGPPQPPAPIPAKPAGTRPGRTRVWLWAVAPVLAGVVLGSLWWVLAPGGMNLLSGNPSLADGTRPESWLPRDLTLAALFLLAGSLTGVLLDNAWREDGAARRIILATAGSAIGAAVAWGTGTLAGQWWGSPLDPSLNPSVSFSLRSLAVLLVWPGSVAVSVFVLTMLGVVRGREAVDGPVDAAGAAGT